MSPGSERRRNPDVQSSSQPGIGCNGMSSSGGGDCEGSEGGGHASSSNINGKFEDSRAKMEIVWVNLLIMIYLHVGGVVGLYYWFGLKCYWQTIVLGFFFGYVGAFGVTCGAHRLWAHKAYKAKLPLRILLAYMQTVACQNSIHEWCRDHRVHHKFTETNADPHNAKRGFFFAHVGWLLVKKHQDVKVKGKAVDMSDLESDPVVMFQKKYFIPLTILASFVIPTLLPCYLWGEDGTRAWYITLIRYTLTLNATWLVNSAAHLWGDRPYDKNMNPAENKFVSIVTPGEGWHNYHHVFPWDYKAAELGAYKHNFSTAMIDFFAWIGLAYDLKSVSHKMVIQRVKRTGDGTHYSLKEEDDHDSDENINDKCFSNIIDKKSNNNDNNDKNPLEKGDHDKNSIESDSAPINSWGWDDEDTPQEDKDITVIHYRLDN